VAAGVMLVTVFDVPLLRAGHVQNGNVLMVFVYPEVVLAANHNPIVSDECSSVRFKVFGSQLVMGRSAR